MKSIPLCALFSLAVLVPLLGSPTAAVADEEVQPAERPALAPSWKDRGEAAYGEKDYAEAIFLYRKWLEADPRDQSTWYNLACCYALAGQKDAALSALERAVDAGWTDAEWPKEDGDLATVRDEPRFAAALARAAAAEGKDAPADFQRHYLKIETIGTYVAMLPPDYAESEKTYPLVVILHGNGSTETKHGRLADRLGREDVIWIAPRAPYPNLGVFFGMREAGWTWRPQDAGDEATAPLGPARLYVDSILAAVDDARARYRVKGDRFFVLGHSMGGFFANVTAVLEPKRVASYFAYAGGLPEEYFDAEKWLAPLKANGVRAFHCHGTADPVVPVTLSEEAHERLTEAGVDATLYLVHDQDHGISDFVTVWMESWLKDVVRGE